MERQSKKAAEDKIRQETQRLIRETAVALPRHIPEKIDLDHFINMTAAKCFLPDPQPTGEEAPPTKQPQTLRELIRMKRAQHRRGDAKPTLQTTHSGLIKFGDIDEKPATAAPETAEAPLPQPYRPLCAHVKPNQKPGEKYATVRERLQEEMRRLKLQFLEQQQAQYAEEEAKVESVEMPEEEEEEVEEEYEKKAAESSSDDDEEDDEDEDSDKENDASRCDDSWEKKEKEIGALAPCDSESEPDEAEIVDDDYGKDEPEPEDNEFFDAEAEESEGDERLDKEESDSLHGKRTSDGRKAVAQKDKTDDISRFAVDEDFFDDDFFAGVGEIPANVETSNSLPRTSSVDPKLDIPLTQQPDLLALCSFASDSAPGSPTMLSTQMMFPSQETGDALLSQPEGDLLNNMESSQERDELLGLLSCPPADFKINNSCRNLDDLEEDVPIRPTKSSARNRLILDDDDEDPPIAPTDPQAKIIASKPKKPLTTNIMDSDSDSDMDEERPPLSVTTQQPSPPADTTPAKEDDVSPVLDRNDLDSESLKVADKPSEEVAGEKKQRWRPEVESEEEEEENNADDEMEEDGDDDADDKDEEEFLARPEEDDEEGLAEYYEQINVRDKKSVAAKFFENEAELSDDDHYHGSGDEDEDALDEVRPEDLAFVDLKNKKLSKKDLRSLQECYQVDEEEDHENLMEVLKERFLHEEDPLLAGTADIERPKYYGLDFSGIIEAVASEPALDPDDPDAILQSSLYYVAQEARERANIEEERDKIMLQENSFVQFYESIACREKMGDQSLIANSENGEESPISYSISKKPKPRGLFGKRPREMAARFTEMIAMEDKVVAPPPLVASISLPGKLTLPGVETSRAKILARSVSNNESAHKRLRLAGAIHGSGKSVFSIFH
ncbi:claspin-like [Paramacrobiotus metropolitanus]|uniref:claspin-like n=1 Tax=Paramacrobiotus metropolitanus TaxID=2943436 RepID=UPI0024460063|nr:claspin-like [Paramacrobiotus metropolitanus]